MTTKTRLTRAQWIMAIVLAIGTLLFLWRQWPTRVSSPIVADVVQVLPGSGLSFAFEEKPKSESRGPLNTYFAKRKKVEMMVQELQLPAGEDPLVVAHKVLADDMAAFKSQDLTLDPEQLPAVLLQNDNARLAWIEFYWQDPWLVKVMLVTPADAQYRDRVVAIREQWPSAADQ